MRKAIILLGHGSRDPLWRQPIEAVAARLVAAHPELAVRSAYLELEPPALHVAAAELIARGATHVSVVPMFLGTGKHAREHVPALVEALRSRYSGVQFTLQAPVGEDARVLDLLASVALESGR